MRKILILWAATILFFWGWHFASYYNTGPTFFLSKAFNDHMYGIYGKILQIPASEVPVKLAWVFFIDTLLVFGIAALRWYKSWLPQSWSWIKHKFGFSGAHASKDKINAIAAGSVHPAE